MCKAISEGGARCAYHVGENATAALVTYVASTTGLGGPATRDAYADLVTEYADAPAPGRAEVDEFFEQQMFRARHEPTLTEKRRSSILRRLQEAIGKVTPTGAQFAAWKNLVAEAWSRVRRRAAVAFVAGALTFSLGACGSPGADVKPEPTATQMSASATATPSPEAPALSSEQWKVKNVNVEDRVVGLHGQAAADEARDLIVDTMKDYVFNEQSIKYDAKGGKAESSKWMLTARKDMTADAAADWTNAVNTYFREKPEVMGEAWKTVMSLSSYGLYNEDMRPEDTSKPLMFDMTVKDMDIDLSSDGRIWVTVNSSAKFNYVAEGKAAVTRADRKQEFWLKEVDGHWKIDGWKGTMGFNAVAS